MATNDLAIFLHTIHPTETGYCELRALPSREQAFLPVRDVEGVAAFSHRLAAENCYVGVATRRTPTNGTLDNCAELWTLFVDLDFKDTPEADARAHLSTFPLPPTLIVNSGGGFHIYWRLKEPLIFPGDAALARTYLRRLAQHFGGDLASAEPARILRLVGTWNHKPDYPRPRPVRLASV